ncbi:MAG: OsmC family protein [Gemmatimonadetes bacterium]|nr:OsmC family protein [Gemmatimonadota bacterium]
MADVSVDLAWAGGLRFDMAGSAGIAVQVDGDSAVAPSPMEALLGALGACAAADIVEILRKGRQDLRGLSLRLTGERRAEIPRRYVRIRVDVRIRGQVPLSRAQRAVALAFGTYCSVRATLDPSLPLETTVMVEPVGQP